MENNIISWITGKPDLKQVSLQELKDIVYQYPYFTLAQLLLTIRMKKENSPEYLQQLQKTALNFQNPQWLHFQLESLELSLKDDQDEYAAPPFVEISETRWDKPREQATFEPELQEVPTVPEELTREKLSAQTEEPPADEKGTFIQPVFEVQDYRPMDKPVIAEDPITIEETQSTLTLLPISPTILMEDAGENDDDDDAALEPEPENRNGYINTTSRLSAMLAAQAIAFKTADVSKANLKLEDPAPLPTKDYFAFVGITADNTLNTDFGRKTKRFSEWLKQMKRIGPEGIIDIPIDPKENKIIMQKADDSNKASTILTETMVKVLVQQDKKEEAIEILEKLSLLKPEKSSYFASLIHNLKNNN